MKDKIKNLFDSMTPNQKRYFTAFASAIVVTVSLFYFMSSLISGGKAITKMDDADNFIEFLRIKPDDLLETRKRKLPKKPPEPKKPPKVEKLKVSKMNAPKAPAMKMDMPKLDLPTNFKGNGPYLGQGGAGGNDAGAMPLVRIEPQYPRKAAMQGKEGWVQLMFDITAMGTVDNVKIIKSFPRRLFDSSARRALLKWKYKPKVVDGKPVTQPKQAVQIDFKLDGRAQ